MKLQNPRHVMLTPESKRHFPMSSITISLRDLGLGANKGKRIDADLDLMASRPTGFLNQDGNVELLNGELMAELTSPLDAEQTVVCNVIDIRDVDDKEELLLRFWYGERAWCQAHCKSRYDAKTQSWQDIVKTLNENDDVALAVADGLFRRKTLRLCDIRWLCAERAADSTISEYKKTLGNQNAI